MQRDMSEEDHPDIVLYDLACVKHVCFSPVVWRIRLMLNYKQIPYKTVFLEFPDIEPTLKGLGLTPNKSDSRSEFEYTVPAIRHAPTETYLMGSGPIAQFLESTYPEPAVPLTSELGRDIQDKGVAAVGAVLRTSVMPREINILSPRAQEYFRRTREARIGHKLEDLLDPVKEEQHWNAESDRIRAAGELMLTNKAHGPFVLGAQPSLTDFFIAGSLQSTRTVDEGVFQRTIMFPGFKEIYEACLPYMEKKD